MHADPQMEGGADPPEVLTGPQPAPGVVVGEDDVDRAGVHRGGDVLPPRHAHVGGEGHRDALPDPGHAGDPFGRILEVLQPDARSLELVGHPEARLHRPDCVGIQAQGDVRPESPPQ